MSNKKLGRPKGVKHKTDKQILVINKMLANYYLRGFNQEDMAARLNISQPEVSKRLKVLRERWIESSKIDFNEAQGSQLEKIDWLERESLRLYIKSGRPKKTIIKEKQPVVKKDEEGRKYITDEGKIIDGSRTEYVIVKQTEKIEDRDPSGYHLDRIRQLIDMRLRVLGLYNQPAKIDESRTTTATIAISEETLEGRMDLFLGIIENWRSRIKSD